MAFYILHHATLYDTLCREDEGRGQETLSIYLHNIVKIFASRLRLVRIFIVIARAGLGPRAFGNKLCLSVYLSSSASVRTNDPLSLHLSQLFSSCHTTSKLSVLSLQRAKNQSQCFVFLSCVLFLFYCCWFSILCSVDYSCTCPVHFN